MTQRRERRLCASRMAEPRDRDGKPYGGGRAVGPGQLTAETVCPSLAASPARFGQDG